MAFDHRCAGGEVRWAGRRVALPGTAGVDRGSRREAEAGSPVGPGDPCTVLTQPLTPPLPTAPDPFFCVEAFDASRRVGLCSQSLQGISAIRYAAPQLPVDAESARAPGAGEKERLHVGTEGPKEG